MQVLRTLAVIWTNGNTLTEQEKATLKVAEEKLGASVAELTKVLTPIMPFMSKIADNGKQVEEKFQSVLKCQQEIINADSGVVSAAPVAISGPLFDKVVIEQLKADIETTNNVCVRAADSSPMRISFSASRILLSRHSRTRETRWTAFALRPPSWPHWTRY